MILSDKIAKAVLVQSAAYLVVLVGALHDSKDLAQNKKKNHE